MKNSDSSNGKARIFYARVDEFSRKEEKYAYLDEKQHVGKVEWQELQPDAKHNWLTVGMQSDFESFIQIGNKATKDESNLETAIFQNYCRGCETGRDSWVYNFNQDNLLANVQRLIETYNEQVYKWHVEKRNINIDSFILRDEAKIKWTRNLKEDLAANRKISFNESAIRKGFYRPFSSEFLYFDRALIYLPALFPRIFPSLKSQDENKVIWLKVGSDWPLFALLVNAIPNVLPQGGSQAFPFYIYKEDGTNRRENITDWALEKFREQYGDSSITKWDIFHYVYGVLHHPVYRERYAANLKRELPRVPFALDFRAFAEAGARLAEIHVAYEAQPEYPLERVEQPGAALDWRVEKMRLSKDKRALRYNEFLTLDGIPSEAFEYRLGNRSALEWVIDQYQVSTDRRSGITNDPNRAGDPQYILRLVGQVITVSLETVKLVRSLPDLGIEKLQKA